MGTGKLNAESTAFSLFLPVHTSLLLFHSMQDRSIILCKILEEKGGWLGFVIPTLSTIKLWKGWGTQLLWDGQVFKILGCATRRIGAIPLWLR